jgi:hypothetical protein
MPQTVCAPISHASPPAAAAASFKAASTCITSPCGWARTCLHVRSVTLCHCRLGDGSCIQTTSLSCSSSYLVTTGPPSLPPAPAPPCSPPSPLSWPPQGCYAPLLSLMASPGRCPAPVAAALGRVARCAVGSILDSAPVDFTSHMVRPQLLIVMVFDPCPGHVYTAHQPTLSLCLYKLRLNVPGAGCTKLGCHWCAYGATRGPADPSHDPMCVVALAAVLCCRGSCCWRPKARRCRRSWHGQRLAWQQVGAGEEWRAGWARGASWCHKDGNVV